MSSNILGIGQSALAAAQAGLATTGHNIANASTPGYSRQMVVQGSAGAQNAGVGYIGKGTQIVDVRRIYNDLLAAQVRSAQSSQSYVTTYHAQLSRINNQFADPVAGLSPTLQNFFKGVQDLASNPNLAASRQTALSSAETLAARFQSLAGQMKEIEQGINGQIQASVGNINVYANQIARLNDAIEKAHATGDGRAANDLLDQRDYALDQLSKETKTTIVKQGESYNVFIGNGQPVVMGARAYELGVVTSPTDPTRLSVGYNNNGQLVPLAESSLSGGTLGGLLEFRSNSLDVAQNQLGRIAIGLAMSFNAQHALGQDLNGDIGGNFFTFGAPSVQPNRSNASSPPAEIGAAITDANALTGSDYKLEAVPGGSYRVTRLSDGNVTSFSSFPQTIDGVRFTLDSGIPLAGDNYLIRPTVNGASGFGVAIADIAKIAAASPIRTAALESNAGSGTISAGEVHATGELASIGLPLTLTHSGNPAAMTGFPPNMEVTVVRPNGSSATVTTDADGSIAYSPGDTFRFGGISFTIAGNPADGDRFTVGPNTGGVGDSRNAVLLGALQTKNTMNNGTSTYQGAYAQLVSAVGNKTYELELTGRAETRFLEQALTAQQAESGVNLDEEATNLLRYQQAYQAAGKMMQTANQLFELLLRLGG
ncbi:MAG TPA: flagellar hook-associated protein FlgK [Noviherbaspirillum sp.]|nr:flagellar hook-associated protein FlgK [Noviherbaspirillum sp.]